MALRANLGFRLIATATHAGNQWLATYGDCPRYSSEAGESVVQRFLRSGIASTVYPVWFEDAARFARDQEISSGNLACNRRCRLHWWQLCS
ncbi:hypothetical protein EBA01_18420 [Xanthomonas oryzae pv. oryzae]|nr:hypothetical protein C0L89_18425 [Xanthomonas oryzae pv. oryzae]AVU04011.1 hypothetical protein C0L90_18740 [Xanthomonas oryzae pv. oryzae]QBI17214.1 hypothetical protein EYR03_19015 [Xanthomonas oryzae pv. oryzae]QBN23886.1 hypothetical protein EBA00_03885 [Xanthomonas oryzae pv. oryzae]QBN29605.1 hypothetical protein EBA01_18420 [Xanthomonas oryzae pv. oryzae]